MGDLTSLERKLVDTAALGGVLECSQLSVERLSVTDDPAHIIRAELLRELLLKCSNKLSDPRGLRLCRARITGTLDLIHVRAVIGMGLLVCSFDHSVLLENAHLPWLALTGSRVPTLAGEGLEVDNDLFLDKGFRATGHGEDGAVRLRGAHVTGRLVMSGAELANEVGPALAGDGLQVGRGLFLDEGFRATGRGERGAVWLRGARITGPLFLRGAELTNEAGPALAGDGLEVDGGLFLRGCRARGYGGRGAVRLWGAHVRGQLVLSSAELTNKTGPALVGSGLRVDGDLLLDEGFRASGHGEDGVVRLRGAHITETLSLRSAELINKAGPALLGDRLQVDGDLLLDGGFRAIGHGEGGAVRLLGAHLTGELSWRGAELINEAGPALDGDWLQVDGALFFDDGFRATGHGQEGALRLVGARITGPLVLSGAELINEVGPALDGDWLQVDGGLFIKAGVRATGHGKEGVVRLVGAHITGQLSLSDVELTNEAGPALIGDQLQVDGSLFLDDGFRATGHGEEGVVRLVAAHITGQLSLSRATLTKEDGLVLDLEDAETKTIFLSPEVVCPHRVAGNSNCDAAARRVNLSGFVYTSLEDSHWNRWLHLIARHTDGYRPQPYQQLAAVQKAVGHDADARKILIAQQQDLRKRGELGGRLARTVHRAWGTLGGYGYRTGRIALALLIVLLAAAGLGVAAGNIPTSPGRYVAMHTAQTNDPQGPCSLTEQIGVGIDRGLPLGATGIRSRCDFDTTSIPGQVLTWATWVLQFVVWALATLFVAGYVGLIHRAT